MEQERKEIDRDPYQFKERRDTELHVAEAPEWLYHNL